MATNQPSCIRQGKNEVIEVRQVQDFEDFPADVREAAAGLTEMQGRGKA